jgi:PAS domain S-box-containing protein
LIDLHTNLVFFELMQNPDAHHNMAELNQLFKLGLEEYDVSSAHHPPRVIQPHGFMLRYDSERGEVCALSQNLADFLKQSYRELLGRSLEDLLGSKTAALILSHYRKPHSYPDMSAMPEEPLLICFPQTPDTIFMAWLHTYKGYLVIEMEQQESLDSLDTIAFADYLQAPLTQMLTAGTGAEKEVFSACLNQISKLTGYDRVGIYQFDGNHNGQVIAEVHHEMLPLLGLHFPSTYISNKAKEMYQHQQLRLIPDVNYHPVKLYTSSSSLDIHLSHTLLGPAPPEHLQYLRKMGISASMLLYIFVDQRLWGLIYCHHPRPKTVKLSHCMAAKYIGRVLGLYLSGKEKDREMQRRNSLHLLLQRMSFSVAAGPDHLDKLLQENQEALREIARADSFLWVHNHQPILTSGIRPSGQGLKRFFTWLDQLRGDKIYYSTCSLPYTEVLRQSFDEYPSGLLAIPLPSLENAYLIWFRRDQDKDYQWAITPDKQPMAGNQQANGRDYHASYADYERQASGLSTPWSKLDIDLALEFSRSLSFISNKRFIETAKRTASTNKHKHNGVHTISQQNEDILGSQYRALVEASPDAIAAVDHTYRLMIFNPRFDQLYEERFGKRPQVGDDCTALLPPHIRDLGKDADLEKSYLDGGVTAFTNRRGETVQTFTSYSIIRDEGGKSRAIQLIVRDISHLWYLGEEAQSLSQKFGILTGKLLPLVWTTDKQGNFCKEQRSWESFTGQQKHEYVGMGWLKAVHMQDRDHLQEHWEQRPAAVQNFEFTVRVWSQQSDAFRYCLIYLMPILDSKHEIGEWFGIGIDIHDLKEKEEKLEKTLLALKESNEQLKNFAHVASHDLQEPLRVVRSYLSLVEERYEKSMDPNVMELIRFAIDGADRMKGLIRELLNYAQLGTDFTPVRVNLGDIVNHVLDGLKLRIEETGARLEVQQLPVVNGVETMLEQLFTNLLSNSLKFKADDVPPHIRIRVKERRLSWKIRVEDNGPGIDPNYVDRIFQIFFRMGSRTKYPGTGMGLAICKRIVNMHGGKIWVNQDYKQGACIEFTLRKYLDVE